MGRFGVLSAVYGGLSAFYFYASDGVWEQLRMTVPDFVVATIFAFMGPIVSIDFVQPVSALPYAAQSAVAVGLFYLYGRSLKSRYIALLGVLWIFSLQVHSYTMGTLSGSPNPLPCEELCTSYMQYFF